MVGRGKTLSETRHDYDRTVIDLMDRLSLHGLKFKTLTTPFMGHTLTPEGLKPSSEIANAILSMP